MTIRAYQEVSCDYCGGAEYFSGNEEDAWFQAIGHGWLKKNGKHWCACDIKNKSNKDSNEAN